MPQWVLSQIRGMYERYRPDKLSEWSDLCYKYKGQEKQWLNLMHKKYLGAPLTPQEWEEMLIQQQSSEEITAQRARRARSLFRGNHIRDPAHFELSCKSAGGVVAAAAADADAVDVALFYQT